MMTKGTRLLTKDIFIDTDCISAFLWVGNEMKSINVIMELIFGP